MIKAQRKVRRKNICEMLLKELLSWRGDTRFNSASGGK